MADPRGKRLKSRISPNDVWYRLVLRDEFEARKIRNPSYSLRAFARDLDVAPSRLSEAMSGTRGISLPMARKMIHKIGLAGSDASQFELSVEATHSRSPRQRDRALEQLKRLRSLGEVDTPKTMTIVDWITEATLKVCQRDGHILTGDGLQTSRSANAIANVIAKKLGVSSFAVESSLRFLGRLGFLGPSKRFKSYLKDRGHGRRLNVEYQQLLELAERVAKSQSSKRPLSLSSVDLTHRCLLLDEKGAESARNLIRECYSAIEKLERSSSRSHVYYFMTQLFPVEISTNEMEKK